MHTKSLAWWDSDNFGDALNPYIFRAFGVNVYYEQSNRADVLALGSLMERLFKGAHTRNETFFSSRPIDVWGSGVHFDTGQHIEQPGIELPEKLIRDARFLAVRGKITKQRMEIILGKKLPNDLALGDPGILLNRIIKGSKIKKYDLAIVSHFHDESSEVFRKIHKAIPSSIIIDIKSDPISFIKKLTQCRALISSAMHPLIVADAYGLPNLWVTTECDKISSYKYRDYYSVFNINEPPVFKLSKKDFTQDDLNDLFSNYTITNKQVLSIQENLIRSFPGLPDKPRKLNFLSIVDILYLRWRVIHRDHSRSSFFRKIIILLKQSLKFYVNDYAKKIITF